MIHYRKLPYLLQLSTLAFLYFIAGKVSFSISHESSIVTIVIFASEGFALAMVLLFGRKLWLGIFIGQFLLAYGTMPILAVLIIALVNSIEALLAVSLFNYFKLNIKLSSTRDIFGLITLIIFVLQPFSAILGNIILLTFSVIEPDIFQKSLFSWWFGNIMGQILLVPTLLLLYAHLNKVNYLKFFTIGLIFALISYLFQVIIPIQNVSLLLSVTIPLIIYISSKEGITYATFSVVVITFVTLYLTHHGIGVFSSEDEIDNLINLNFYFLSQMLLVLTVGTLFDERRRKELELESLVKKELEKNREQTLMMLQQSRLAQMGQVINMIAHQWRQPLNNLLLIIEVLVYKYGKNEIAKKEIDTFQEESTLQIKQMSNTIDDFRDFFQPRKDKKKFLLNDVIEHLTLIMTPLFNVSNIHLIFKEKEDIYYYGYENELAQALLNILYNAKDALIENHIEEKIIEIELEKREDCITINISDNAGGIPLTIINRIFDPYFTTKSETKGTGLGLYMSKIIIEKHMHGKLIVSNREHGAFFMIQLKEQKTTPVEP